MNFSYRFLRSWPSITATIVGIVLLCAGLFVFSALPPRTVVMATGAEGGAQHELGLLYREILARSGIKLELRPTGGSLENLALLRDLQSDVSIGFLQAGTPTKEDLSRIQSLGTVFYEPIWLFFRSEISGSSVEALHGKRVSIGPEGSGTRELALKLIDRLKLADKLAEVSGNTPQEAADRIIAGDIDVAFIITAWKSPVIQRLVLSRSVELRSFPFSEAFTVLFPYLEQLTLPAGVADLAANRPAKNVALLASKVSLGVRADLHPAIQQLLLSAASQIHSQPGVFQKAAQFPAAESIDLPISEPAQRFYKNGRSFLQNYLPFWIATLLEQLIVVLLPLAVLIYPIAKIMPNVYDYLVRLRVTKLYQEMRSLEQDLNSREAAHLNAAMLKLNDLFDRTYHLALPGKHASTLYTLRTHIDYVRTHVASLLRAQR